MGKNKLAIIGGSGLYDVEGIQKNANSWKTAKYTLGKTFRSDILKIKYKGQGSVFSYQDTEGVILFHLQILILEQI